MPAQKTTLKEFESVFPKLEEAILDHARSYKLPQAELEWLKKVSWRRHEVNETEFSISLVPFFLPVMV